MWANAARSHMAASLSHLPAALRSDPDFFVGNMLPTCIDPDKSAAAAVNRRTLISYVKLPNYQNYWIEAGYEAWRTAGDSDDEAAFRRDARAYLERADAPQAERVRRLLPPGR